VPRTAAPATLQQLLARARTVPATGLRFVDGGERERFVAWSEVAARAERVAGALAALGVAPGERVAIVFPTAPEYFDAFFGALLAGAVPVPLYPPVRLGRLDEYRERTARMLTAVEGALLLADARLAPLVAEAAARCPPRLGVRTLADLPAEEPRFAAGAPEELGLIQFSSGTTGDPRPVALTQRALLAQIAALNARWPDTPEVTHSGVSWLPLYHDMGLVGCVLPALERPAVLTLLPPERFVARPALWLRAIARFGATISVAPNFAYALAAERVRDDELAGCDLSSWRFALCGAEPVAAATLRAFAARFARWGFRGEALTPVYGLSEAALAVTFPPLGRGLCARTFDRAALADVGRAVEAPAGRELVSVGHPLPGFALALRDERGAPVGEGRVGRIFVAGPSLLREYFGQPAATAAALAGDWLDTGDLGFLLAGELYLTGRAKDVLLVRGRKHAPSEVEEAIAALPGVRRGCAVAVSEAVEGGATESLHLFVEHQRRARAADRAALPARCRAAVLAATGLALDEIHVLAPGTLPRTSSGKLRRAETLRRHRAGALTPPSPSGPSPSPAPSSAAAARCATLARAAETHRRCAAESTWSWWAGGRRGWRRGSRHGGRGSRWSSSRRGGGWSTAPAARG
jgi:fatty-acyl-CoA synthase